MQSLQKNGRSYSSIQSIRGVLRPAFEMARKDELIMTNPFSFELADALINDSEKREALSPENERKLMKFIEGDEHYKRYYYGIKVLFKTGLRISEFCGLTVSDIDFANMTIDVNCQLQRQRDGKTGFLFFDKNDNPMIAMHWEKYFQHIREKYNRIYKVPMPLVTPHVCRHTYCTRMAKTGISLKTLQHLMGHSDVAITMNVYTHFDVEDARADMVKSGVLKLKKVKNAR